MTPLAAKPEDRLTGLEEGEFYVFRKGKLEQVQRDPDDRMRRVRITEEAYQRALQIGQTMRPQLRGYKPDVSLIISAILLNTLDEEEVQQSVRAFVLDMFQS